LLIYDCETNSFKITPANTGHNTHHIADRSPYFSSYVVKNGRVAFSADTQVINALVVVMNLPRTCVSCSFVEIMRLLFRFVLILKLRH